MRSSLQALSPLPEARAAVPPLPVRRLGAGPRLVLLHGGPGLDHHVLLPLAQALARRFEVWLPDLPGHGAHHAPEAPLPGLREVYEGVVAWLRSLEGGPGFLVGHSLGAWVVREALRRGAVRPQAAVLLCPPARLPEKRPPGALTAPAPTGPGTREEALADFLREVTAELGEPPGEDFLEAVAGGTLRLPTAYGVLLAELGSWLSRPPPPCRPGCPVLVVGGHLDATCPPGAVAGVAAATEGAQLRLLRDSGHLPWALGPHEVAREVEGFLAALSPAGGR